MELLNIVKNKDDYDLKYKEIINNIETFKLYDILQCIEFIFNVSDKLDKYMVFIDDKFLNKRIIFIIIRERNFENNKICQRTFEFLDCGHKLYITNWEVGTLSDILKREFNDSTGIKLKYVILSIFKTYRDNILSLGAIGVKRFGWCFYDTINNHNKDLDYYGRALLPYRYGYKKKFKIVDMIIWKIRVRKYRKIYSSLL